MESKEGNNLPVILIAEDDETMIIPCNVKGRLPSRGDVPPCA